MLGAVWRCLARRLRWTEAPEQAWRWHRYPSVEPVGGSRDPTRQLDHAGGAEAAGPQEGVASMTWRHTQAAVGLAVTLMRTATS